MSASSGASPTTTQCTSTRRDAWASYRQTSRCRRSVILMTRLCSYWSPDEVLSSRSMTMTMRGLVRPREAAVNSWASIPARHAALSARRYVVAHGDCPRHASYPSA
jgi:hypothetical protein